MSVSAIKNVAARLLAASMAAVLVLGLMPVFGTGSAGGGSYLTASASEQEAAAQLPAGSVAGSSNDTPSEDGAAESGDSAAPGGVAASDGGQGSAGAQDSGSEASAELQSADAKAADAAGSATGTTIKIAVYRSSYPLVWDTGDADAPDATKVVWSKPDAWPKEGSPGSAVGTYAGYSEADEPTRPGFEFLGWSAVKDDPTVAGKLDTLQIPKGTEPVAGDDGVKRITLHALWAPIEYSVVFDLTKNPEDASAVPSFNWTTGKGTFSDLGGGRYRLSGVTLEDYDPERGLIEISTPSRGTGGYRFLSWAEPDSQQSPTVAMQPSGTSKWYVNPVALPYYDYEPVLTARWSLSFDVDVPSQITFDEYDSLEVEGNLTDTTDKDAIDEESPDAHDKGKLAHFCSQSTAVDYKIVALRSEMQPTAKDILTTSDSSKATQDEVLGSEKLLSLFAASDKSESAGVHFKLTDAIDMDDSSRFGAFVIPKQAKEYSDGDFARDDEERLYVSYRLNLSNKVDGATEPNHGLVTPGNVNEGDRTPIAKVSYEFAVADDEVEKAIPGDPFYIEDNGIIYGFDYIKDAAADLSAKGTSSSYYSQFKGWLDKQVMTNGNPGAGPYFKLRVDNAYHDIQLIGICQDTKASGGKAGLSFAFKEIYAFRDYANSVAQDKPFRSSMNDADTVVGGWRQSRLRDRLRTTFFSSLQPDVQAAIPQVVKYQQLNGGTTSAYLDKTTDETIWLPSTYEVFGTAFSQLNEAEALTTVAGYVPFQYQAFQGNGGSSTNARALKRYYGSALNGAAGDVVGGTQYWFLRTTGRLNTHAFGTITNTGVGTNSYANGNLGVVPCFCL